MELERKNAELEAAQQFISSIEAAMTDVLIVCDFKGRIQRECRLRAYYGVKRAWHELLSLAVPSVIYAGMFSDFSAAKFETLRFTIALPCKALRKKSP